MEKSLKLINKTINFSDINFSSFSSSKNWVGFFEIENKSWSRGVNAALSLFVRYFKQYKDEVFVVSALNYDNRVDTTDKLLTKMKPLHDKFKNLGILQKSNEYFDLSATHDISLPAMCLRIDALEFDEIKDLAKLIMSYTYSINQWCFIIFPNLNLAIYPHDEKGFGCIGLNDDITNGVKFLNFCRKDANAKVVIEKKETNLKQNFMLPKTIQKQFSSKQEIENVKKDIFCINNYFNNFINQKGLIKDLQIKKLKSFLQEGLICLDVGIFFIKNLKKEKKATREYILNENASCRNLSDFEWWTNHIEIKNTNLSKDKFLKDCFLFVTLVKKKIRKLGVHNVLLYLSFDLENDIKLNADFRLYTLRKDEKIIDFHKDFLYDINLFYEIV
ncbi:hypothetical protein [Campylobacter majalis]|uniref:hypothetical protein n=1 Tax=Campylobacter majalis TaxID=2790656 RepID=UPI003D6832F4